jgi:hypothetical protein
MKRNNPLESAETVDATVKPQGQKLDGDNLQDVLDSGANAWRVGRQQFFTPHELGRTLMLPLPAARESFVDLTMGAGALLVASGARDLYGIDIDSRLARKPPQLDATSRCHTACADLTKFYPLLQEIDWRFDLCGLNPPFSVRWHKNNLVKLIDSECEAVRETFGKGRKPTIDSVLATFLIALDRMTDRGEGFLICSEACARKLMATPAGAHIWLWLTLTDEPGKGDPRNNCVFGRGVRQFDVAVVYFARSHTQRGSTPTPHFTETFASVRSRLIEVHRSRQLMRKGLSIFYPDHFCPLTRELWDAAKGEWLRVNRTEVPGDYNIWLRKDGTIWRHLTPFQTWSGKIPRAKADLLNRLAGQTPMSLVVQKATRLALLEAIGKAGATPWRVDPMLVAAVENAVTEYHAQRAPFYPLNEVQRLGYLDEEDMIKCKLEGLTGFKPGKTYPLSSETIDVERQDERLNLLGDPEEITLQGKELAFYIEDERGDKHSFCGTPPEQQVERCDRKTVVTRADTLNGRHHDLHALIRYFEIPEVADVAQIDTDRYDKFVNQIRAIEKAVNERAA